MDNIIKPRERKPSIKCKNAVIKIIENRGNISKAMREVGYSENSSKNPKNLTESKGFKVLCKELGLTDNLLITSLKDDILAKPKDRSKELALGFKVLGHIKGDNELNLFTPKIEIADAEFKTIIQQFTNKGLDKA